MERFHGRQKEKLLLLLQNEVWSSSDVPAECQDLVNMLGRGHGIKPSPQPQQLPQQLPRDDEAKAHAGLLGK